MVLDKTHLQLHMRSYLRRERREHLSVAPQQSQSGETTVVIPMLCICERLNEVDDDDGTCAILVVHFWQWVFVMCIFI